MPHVHHYKLTTTWAGNDGGHFQEMILNPVVTVAEESMIAQATALHHEAHRICYIAASVNFEVKCNPVCDVVKTS